MAEQNPTTFANDNDCKAASPRVAPKGAASATREGLSRRMLMQVITSATAVPAVAFLPAVAAATPTANGAIAAWRNALTKYERAKEAYERVASQYAAACDALNQGTDRDAEAKFERYGLCLTNDAGQSREQLIHQTEISVVIQDFNKASVARDGELTAKQFSQVTTKAVRLVDAFLAYHAKRTAHREAVRPRYDAAEKRHDEAADRLWNARRTMQETPAPDAGAMLAKMGILLSYLRECDSEDVASFAAVTADAKRLLVA